ncbi:hypothetical protein M422DRAFT_260736 [Sphaerobolus stellatus SS14]|uniref:Uncharacterized protein n=1 Tax=Sphaerobolus stellatus (strain SS14) TaxID=990650 RepID=A0A0C9VHW4_SPHS4|nr:hypothetical protein M422DRAFT_260736 [Sphaerobolus stellatus SS14]
MFILGHHTSLPMLDWDLHAEQDKASGEDGSALASPQKKAVEGYQMAVSLNIQDVILMEASEEHYVETVPVTEPVDEPEFVRGCLQISARNLSVRNYPSRQPPSSSDYARDSPSAHSSTPVAGEWEVWLETMVVWWRVYAHIVIAHE